MAIVIIIACPIILQEHKIIIFFRYLLYKYCSDFKKEIKKEFPNVPYFDLDYETEDYINKIKESSFWAGDLEISQSIYLYNINIAVYIKNNSNNILY